MTDPALACIEVSSIARGVMLLDVIVKRAPVRLVHHGRHSNGKYIIVLSGGVAEVEEAHRAALDSAGPALVGHVLLSAAHAGVVKALNGKLATSGDDALYLVEMTAVWSAIEALDVALKYVDCAVVDLHLASGIGGKGYFAIQGDQADLEAVQDLLLGRFNDQIVDQHVIARPHHDMLAAVGHAGPFQVDQG
ncbi:MAG: BMC domain-containing protein [bacterium]